MQTTRHPITRWLIPQTRLGRRAIVLIGLHVAFMLVFLFLVAAGARGGEHLLDNLLLTIPIFMAGAAAVAAAGTALYSIIRQRERSILDILVVLIGLFVLSFAVGEVLFSH